MLRTEPASYEVVGQQNNHLWLEVLNGGDKGIRVSVPVHHDEYDDTLQKQVLDLTVGDIRQFELKSEAERSPNWRIDKIEKKILA